MTKKELELVLMDSRKINKISISIHLHTKGAGHRVFSTKFIDYIIQDEELILCFDGEENETRQI